MAIRRYDLPPQPGRRYGPRPGCYAVLLRAGRVLLTYQRAPHDEHQLPGGGVEPGEHPIAALHREVFEETGWSIGTPRHLGVWRRYTYMPEYDRWADKVCHVWLARPIRRLGPPVEPDHRPLWLPPAAAQARLSNRAEADFLALALRQAGAERQEAAGGRQGRGDLPGLAGLPPRGPGR